MKTIQDIIRAIAYILACIAKVVATMLMVVVASTFTVFVLVYTFAYAAVMLLLGNKPVETVDENGKVTYTFK